MNRLIPYVAAAVLAAGCASAPKGGGGPVADAGSYRVEKPSQAVIDPQYAVATPMEAPEDSGVVDLVIDEPWPTPSDWRQAAEEEAAEWPPRVATMPHQAIADQVSLRIPYLLPEEVEPPASETLPDDLSLTMGESPQVAETALLPEPTAAVMVADDAAELVAAIDPLHDVAYDLPVEVNEAVHTYLEYFQTRMRPTFSRYLIRSGRYIPAMKGIFREHGLPEDLVYIAMIESGFNPYAYSHARASGPWQFIATTGKRYGLRQDYWVDERREPLLATHAAARYFKDLYGRFGDWFLCMAAYNAGEGKVAVALKRTGATSFWELREAYALPQETRDYVPKYLAAAIIAKNPEEYGFYLEHHAPIDIQLVEVDGPTALSAIARAAEVPLEEIKFLNPQLRRGLTPPDKKPYKVAIPGSRTELFAANFPKIKAEEEALWAQKARSMGGGYLVRHKVRRGESLGLIAKKYGSTVRRIQSANKMGRSTLIRVGKTLLVPTGKQYAGSGGGKQVHYLVKRGDSLWKIAARYNVRLKDLMNWNGLKKSSVLRPGDRLLVKRRG